MPGVKTAISLNEELFSKVNQLADDLHISRSKVFTLAVQDYVKKQENQALLARLNEAYKDSTSRRRKKNFKIHARQAKKID